MEPVSVGLARSLTLKRHPFWLTLCSQRQNPKFSRGTVGQGSVRISAPLSVTSTVCSNCAVRRRSVVTAVQPSCQISKSMLPRVSMGSIVKVMPVSMTVSQAGSS